MLRPLSANKKEEYKAASVTGQLNILINMTFDDENKTEQLIVLSLIHTYRMVRRNSKYQPFL